jgi:hypothetical protein
MAEAQNRVGPGAPSRNVGDVNIYVSLDQSTHPGRGWLNHGCPLPLGATIHWFARLTHGRTQKIPVLPASSLYEGPAR